MKPNKTTVAAMKAARTMVKPHAYYDDLEFYTTEQFQEFDKELRIGLLPLYATPKKLTKKQILELAKQAGFVPYKNGIDWSSNYDEELKKFTRLIEQRFGVK